MNQHLHNDERHRKQGQRDDDNPLVTRENPAQLAIDVVVHPAIATEQDQHRHNEPEAIHTNPTKP